MTKNTTASHIHLLHGSPGKRPEREQPKPVKGALKKPAWVKGRAAQQWRRLAPQLEQSGTFAPTDTHALGLLCQAMADYLKHSETLETEGYTYTAKTNAGAELIRVRPEAVLAERAWRRCAMMMRQFGLTPTTRAHAELAPEDDVDDETGDLFG